MLQSGDKALDDLFFGKKECKRVGCYLAIWHKRKENCIWFFILLRR